MVSVGTPLELRRSIHEAKSGTPERPGGIPTPERGNEVKRFKLKPVVSLKRLNTRKEELMGYVEKAICQHCAYESEPLTVGDGNHIIVICHHCNSVVNPELISFKLTKPPCPNCNHPLQESGFVDALMLESSPTGEPIESKYQCPRCKEHKLAFQEVLHFRMTIEERFPQEGEFVHGVIDTAVRLKIPGIFLLNDIGTFESSLYLRDMSAYERQKAMELEVTKIEIDSDNYVSRITLRFVRYLSEAELDVSERS
jgi:hypothetical protein